MRLRTLFPNYLKRKGEQADVVVTVTTVCAEDMKYHKRILAALLAILLAFGSCPLSATAATENTPKEEVVYVNLKADGTVEEIYVVNIFELAQAGKIVDYGAYTTLRNMTGTQPIEYKNNVLRVDAAAGKHYYEGKLQSTVIPWNIDIRYFVNGKEYSPEQVAGKSGALKITVDITRNEQYQGNFYDSLALQVSLTLDTAKCRNIVAPDATVANVGRSKQLTHTILPGAGAHLEITSDVVDFAMDGIAINGISLNLNVDVDTLPLMERVDELFEAIGKLDEGTTSLHEGVTTLRDATQSELATGVESLADGAQALEDGAQALQTGGTALRDGAQTLHTGAAALNSGIQTLDDGIQKMQAALNLLNAESATLTDGSGQYLDAMEQLQSSLNGMQSVSADVSKLTAASAEVLSGITKLVNGAQALEQNVSFDALKRVMAQHGLDVDSLQSNNSIAMDQLREAIDSNQDLGDILKMFGYDISHLFSQLEQVILLLGANNAFIDGTGSYLNTVNDNISELAYGTAMLQTNYIVFDDAISDLADGLGSLGGNMGALTNAVNTLVSEYRRLDIGIGSYTGAVAEIVSAYTEIANGAALLAASGQELEKGADDLYQGTSDLLGGIVEIYEGSVTLKDGTDKMNNGASELISGIAQLYDGSSKLQEGASTLHDKTSEMDGVLDEQIGDILSGITGSEAQVHSFVSEENTNVEGVQFVIKTEAIKQSDVQQQAEPVVPKLTFWQKILKLFGLLD